MLLIAKRSFRNPGRVLEIENHQHPDHVHKGAIFSIGTEKATFKELSPQDKTLVLQLNAAQCVADATDKKVLEAVKAEVEEEERVAERQAREARTALTPAAPRARQQPQPQQKPEE
jgi:hypothetical protein